MAFEWNVLHSKALVSTRMSLIFLQIKFTFWETQKQCPLISTFEISADHPHVATHTCSIAHRVDFIHSFIRTKVTLASSRESVLVVVGVHMRTLDIDHMHSLAQTTRCAQSTTKQKKLLWIYVFGNNHRNRNVFIAIIRRRLGRVFGHSALTVRLNSVRGVECGKYARAWPSTFRKRSKVPLWNYRLLKIIGDNHRRPIIDDRHSIEIALFWFAFSIYRSSSIGIGIQLAWHRFNWMAKIIVNWHSLKSVMDLSAPHKVSIQRISIFENRNEQWVRWT